MSMNKKEAVLLGYKVLYNRAGKLITERVSTDINEPPVQYRKNVVFTTARTIWVDKEWQLVACGKTRGSNRARGL